MKKLIECVPNVSEGRDIAIIRELEDAAQAGGAKLLHTDRGADANRTVLTLAGIADEVMEGAFQLIKRSTELIDMTRQGGCHPRIGSTDVCPLVPLGSTSMEECVDYARRLGSRVGDEIKLPVFLYEYASFHDYRRSLPYLRRGQFEGLAARMADPLMKPDYGPGTPHPTAGAAVIGARNFLIAFNINLATSSSEVATSIAERVRSRGGKRNSFEQSVRIEGLPCCRAIGWRMDEFGCAQVSTNILDFEKTGIREVFDRVKGLAHEYGTSVTGSELVGLIPRKALLDAAKGLVGIGVATMPPNQAIEMAVDYLGLNAVKPFVAADHILENCMQREGLIE